MTCRFKIKLPHDEYQCCVFSGTYGWAHVWKSGEEFSDPCNFPPCVFKIDGDPIVRQAEVSKSEFLEIAGNQIRSRDWKEFSRRGIKPGRN